MKKEVIKMGLNVGVGVSAHEDSYTAGMEAAKKALEELNSDKANVLLVFGAPKFNQQKLLDGVTSVTKKTPMIGGTSAGERSTKGLSVQSVVVMAMASKDVKFSVGLGKDIKKNAMKAGAQAAKAALKNMPKNIAKTFLITPDGLAGDGMSIVEGAQSVLGENFEIVGGSAGDEAAFKKTFQYYNGKVYQNVVPGLLIGGKIKTATGVRSGWESIGNRLTCTKAIGNVVYKFGDKSALDVYKDYLGEKRSRRLPAVALEYPFGMIDKKAKIKNEEYFQLRAPMSVDEKKGTISLAARIPEGTDVTITGATRDTVINGSKVAAVQAKETLGKIKPKVVFMFSCVARKIVLARRTKEEITAVKNILGKDVPLIGFYTYGEIGPIDKRVKSLKSTRYHNQTVVLLALGN